MHIQTHTHQRFVASSYESSVLSRSGFLPMLGRQRQRQREWEREREGEWRKRWQIQREMVARSTSAVGNGAKAVVFA
jgi:hypothetical protein